jgi:hypothetical protein
MNSIQKTLGWSAVVFCACETMQLFSVVFCVVRAMYKFDFRLVTNGTPYKLWPVEREPCSNTGLLCFCTSVKGLYPCCTGQLHSLEQEAVLSKVWTWVAVGWLGGGIQSQKGWVATYSDLGLHLVLKGPRISILFFYILMFFCSLETKLPDQVSRYFPIFRYLCILTRWTVCTLTLKYRQQATSKTSRNQVQ